jgi:hypothetical protein
MWFIRRNIGAIAACSVVTGFLAGGHRRLSFSIEHFRRAIAPIKMPFRHELFDSLIIKVKPLRLIIWPFVPIQPEPLHPLKDREFHFFGAAFRVGIVYAQYERSVVMARVKPAK